MRAYVGLTRRMRALRHLGELTGWCTIAFLIFVTLFVPAGPAMADKRVALVIGNAAYQHATPLGSSLEDVRIVAAALQTVGFTLSGGAALVDLDRSGLDRAIQQFGRDSADADVAFVYYAGHAVQFHGSSFLVPVDAAVSKEADLESQTLHVGLLLQQLESSASRLNILVLDACHSNPFEGHGLDGLEPGLAPVHTPANTLVSFAAQPDMAVPATSDANNLFAMTLAQTIQRPGADVLTVFNELGLAVKRRTAGAQQPFVQFSPISGRFVFVAAAPAARASTAVASPPSTLPRERAVLYDEDVTDPKGKHYEGTVVWRTEESKASSTQAANRVLRADIEIPERKLRLVLVLRRNSDPSMPASHLAELTFSVPPDFAGGGIGNVPGMLMKSSEQARGTPLAGLAVKVTNGSFLVGLSNVDADRQRNLQLLQQRSWIDIPLVYDNSRRGILAIGKGASGDRAFADWDEH
ncbi:caspase family protein [Bradyrhizobium sp. HKCCYLS1011]|uniref:caspase family protein n=1 Tax=Bradyrhizobium sp. HKCCYLS1011 TaxID=3420733 RepID=UPI003EB8F371